ncbi:SDR family oxidoreductase [Mesorhizobium sp. B2-5-13]|uniref:SDR family oxidoreductase n=1 Tax=unclassified Mesorhizobium TaxID=325217 RepID=UPI00112C28CE|nr:MULTISPECIES: SDR family oxidoreductase [unclassified Mesorhizobium]TPJ41770.1 SDR family oxidoreductase [Mesorhizobium sp. B2-6-5]TPJ85347.1 SDR family oxidoreductase [Mesorhizobium sp. B2-5-13]TPK49447.1 SDR family oxidoreductase [Mesorhizobium sp. B2-5-5]TPM05826.1 SDR family oxidoreductase [Mesorhizobium sp. B2-3-11]
MSKATAVALVTGGAKRIGKAIVEDLASHGFAVAIHSNRSHDEADALAAGINRSGGRAAVVAADLTDMDAVSDLVGQAEAALGPISLLVNNASLFVDDSVQDFDWHAWDRHFAIHVKTPALLAQNFARSLPEGQEGLIVNVIDQRVWRPTPRYFSYALSKSALWTQTQMLAQALGPGIRVNAIGPGPTLKNVRQDDSDFDAQVAGLILRRGPELPEFGATIRYLWETRSVTGQMIALDGGQHLAWQTPDVTGMAE